MDTSQQVTVVPRDKQALVAPQRQRRSISEKRRIAEETLEPGASVARAHGINANQVFGWRRLYLGGRLGEPKPGIKLLPVRMTESKATPVEIEPRSADFVQPPRGTIYIEFRQAQVRIESNADPALLRVLLECLRV